MLTSGELLRAVSTPTTGLLQYRFRPAGVVGLMSPPTGKRLKCSVKETQIKKYIFLHLYCFGDIGCRDLNIMEQEGTLLVLLKAPKNK